QRPRTSDAITRTATRRPQLPGHRQRSEVADPALHTGMDGPQRLGPGRDPDRAVRLDDGPAPVPDEPGAGEELHPVHGPAGDPAEGSDTGADATDVPAFGAAAGAGHDHARDGGRHGPDDGHGIDPVHDGRGPRDLAADDAA